MDLSKHDYQLEPNVTFTPDGHWIVFRSNMHGPTHVYAVETSKKKEVTDEGVKKLSRHCRTARSNADISRLPSHRA